MSHDEHIHPIGAHIQRQHHELQRLVRGIGHFFMHPPVDASLDDRSTQVCEMLAQLRHNLADHFSQEDDCGFMEEAVARLPRLGSCVLMLEKQHPEFLSELDHLILSVKAEQMTAEAWGRRADEFARFAQALFEHEDIENQILQEGFNDDLGLECDKPLTKDET